MPHIHSFWQASLDRQSDSKDEKLHFIPPWTSASLWIAFSKRPSSARTATVVPLEISLPTLRFRVAEINEWHGGCDGEEARISWEDVVPVERSDYLNAPTLPDHLAQSPFEAVIIYPAVPFARQVPPGSLTDEMLPKGVFRSTVTAAIDVTGEGAPDLLVVEYCCGDPAAPDVHCECTNQDYYQMKDGKWVLVRHLKPC